MSPSIYQLIYKWGCNEITPLTKIFVNGENKSC
jgi:hypothetical protein